MTITTYGRKAVASKAFQADVLRIHRELGHDEACVFIAIALCADQNGMLLDQGINAISEFMNTHVEEIENVLFPLIMERNRRN